MTKRYEHPFNRAVAIDTNNLPDSLSQDINDLCSEILKCCLVRNGRIDNPNLGLAATQKALAILIGNFFPEEKEAEICAQISEHLPGNVKAWRVKE